VDYTLFFLFFGGLILIPALLSYLFVTRLRPYKVEPIERWDARERLAWVIGLVFQGIALGINCMFWFVWNVVEPLPIFYLVMALQILGVGLYTWAFAKYWSRSRRRKKLTSSLTDEK